MLAFITLTSTSGVAQWNSDGGPWGSPDDPPWNNSPDIAPWNPNPPNPGLWKYQFKMNCMDAAQALNRMGYQVVNQIRCLGDTYSYIATQDGTPYHVEIDPWSGQLLSANPAN